MSGAKINAELADGAAQVSYQLANGSRVSKAISLDSFVRSLTASSEGAAMKEILPLGMRVRAAKGQQVIVGYEFPERVHHVRMQRSGKDTFEEYDTILPWGLTFIEMNKTKDGYKFSSMFQMALKGPILNGDTMLFEWPGTNTYNDHRICTGDLKFPSVDKIEQTAGFPFLFYNGVNTHIVSGGKFNHFNDKEGRKVDDPFKLYWNLRVDKDNPVRPYPYDILRQAITLNAWLEGKGYK